MSATWLLPVALVPMAWDAGDIYGPLPVLDPENKKAGLSTTPSPNKQDAQDNTQKKSLMSRLF